MRGDDASIRRLFDRDRLGMEAVLAPRLLGPAADRPAAPQFPSFIAHEGVFGKTGGDPVGIIGIGRGEVLGEGAWQFDDHGAAPLRLVSASRPEIRSSFKKKGAPRSALFVLSRLTASAAARTTP